MKILFSGISVIFKLLAYYLERNIAYYQKNTIYGELEIIRELFICVQKGKSDIFTKRTIRPNRTPAHAETASDAFALSIGERARVDMPYMMELTGKDEQTLVRELTGVIFVEPFQTQEDGSAVYLAADEYLSGDVRQKLRTARVAAEQDPAFRVNVQALEQVQPRDLTAS